MTGFRTRASVWLSGALVLGVAVTMIAPRPALAQANCQWYGTTALKQQQDNLRLACNFKGEAWGTDLKAHMTWCASVAPEVWRTAAQKRDQELAACAAKKK